MKKKRYWKKIVSKNSQSFCVCGKVFSLALIFQMKMKRHTKPQEDCVLCGKNDQMIQRFKRRRKRTK